MRRIISLVLVMIMISSLGMVGFAEESLSENNDLSSSIADKYGIVVKEDNDYVKVVTCPTEEGIVTIKYYKKTGDYEIIDEKGNSSIIEKSDPGTYEKELMEEELKSASYPDGAYQHTFVNYEYEAHNFVAPWELRRPNGLSYYYFYSYETSSSVNALDAFADDVEVMDDVEKDLILSAGAGIIDLLYAFAEAAPGGQIAIIYAIVEAGVYAGFDFGCALLDVSDAMDDCWDSYYNVYNNYAN